MATEEANLFKEDHDSPREKSKDSDCKDEEKSSIAKQNQTVIEITDSALQACWQKLFTIFVDHLPDLQNVSGMQAIPYLQVRNRPYLN